MKKKLNLLLLVCIPLFFTISSFADVTYTTQPVAAGNVSQGSTNNIVYIVKVDVTTTAVTINGIQFTLIGTHDNNDLVSVKIYTNSTASLTGATLKTSNTAAFAAPHFYNLGIGTNNIAAGASLYFIIAVDVNASGSNGNTIKLDGSANPVTFSYSVSPTITNNQTDIAGTQTIQAAVVTYTTEPVAAGNVTQGSTNNIVYIAKLDVTDLPVTITAIQLTLTGTHDANDLTTVSVYTNTTPSLTGATVRNSVVATFAAPHAYNVAAGTVSISAGASLYYIIAVNVSNSGTSGNTIKVDGAANPVTFTYSTAPTITNNQTDIAGVKTIQAAAVTYTTEPVAAGNVTQGSTNNIVYIAKLDVTDLPVTITAIQFTLTGTHDANDLTSVLIYTNTTPSLTGATVRNSVVATFAAPHAYNVAAGTVSISAGASLYYIIAVNVNAGGTGGNTIKLDGAANPVTFTYSNAPTITNNQTDIAGVKTIQATAVTYTTEPVAAGNVTQGSTNNIVYIAKVDVTDLPVTITAIQFTLTGTHDANDLTSVLIYTNTTPSLTGATVRNSVLATFAAPHAYNAAAGTVSIAAGASLYYIIAVNVNAGGTGGNTIKLDGAANPVTFTYSNAPTITNNQTDIAGVKTIQTAGVTYTTEPVAAGNVIQGSTNNIVYIAKVDVTDLPVTITAIQFTLTGTHDANDLTSVLIYTNTTPSLTGATVRNSVLATFAAPHAYNVAAGTVSIAAGASLYYIIAVNVNASGTGGNTIKLDGTANPVTFTYNTAPPITNNQTDDAGVKTIQAAGVTYTTEPVAAGNVSQGSTNNIVYIAKVDVSDLPVTITAIQFTLTGTHDANDLTSVLIYTNTTPSLTGATVRNSVLATFAAPHAYNVAAGTVSIAAGASLYYIISVNVNADGTGGNTIKLDGAANPVTFTYNTAPPITNNQTDAAGAKTIISPAVAMSSTTIASSNIIQGSSNNIIYIAKADVTILPATCTDLHFTLSGTHDNNDLTTYTIYSNTTPDLTGATNIGTGVASFAAPHSYTKDITDQVIAPGTTRYFIITVALSGTANPNNTVKLDGAANPVTFTYMNAPAVTNNQTDAAGVKTITSVLPLNLLSFTGKTVHRQYVQLQWQTASEINTKLFEVEYSTDGSHYNSIATVAAAGNSTQNKPYSYLHLLPVDGNNFYRLKMIDRDGMFTYSPVINQQLIITSTSVSVFPNPVIQVLQMHIQAIRSETVKATLYSAEGKSISEKTLNITKGNNQIGWNVSAIPAGNYFIVFNNKEFENIQIIKQQ